MLPQRSQRRRQGMPERAAVEGKVQATPRRTPTVIFVVVIFVLRPRVHPRLHVSLVGCAGDPGDQAKLTRQPVVRYVVILQRRSLRTPRSGREPRRARARISMECCSAREPPSPGCRQDPVSSFPQEAKRARDGWPRKCGGVSDRTMQVVDVESGPDREAGSGAPVPLGPNRSARCVSADRSSCGLPVSSRMVRPHVVPTEERVRASRIRANVTSWRSRARHHSAKGAASSGAEGGPRWRHC